MSSAASSLPLHDLCRDIHLQGSTLYADCQKLGENYAGPPENAPPGTYQSSAFPLDMIIGNVDGRFVWGYKGFSELARNIRLEGTILSAELQKADGSWGADTVDLDARFYNKDGVLTATDIPVVVLVPQESEHVALQQFSQMLDTTPELKFSVVEEKDGAQLWYANAKVEEASELRIFKTYTADATASFMHVAQQKGAPIEQVSVDVFTASASATLGETADITTYAGVDARLSLVKAKASIFDLDLGVGLETGAGIKNGSVDVHVAGCGVTIGKTMSISAFGSSFGIDFGRLF